MATMQAARLHEIGTVFSVDEIERPSPGPNDVVVRVKACGVIPNMKNVIAHYAEWFPYLPLPPLPAIYGLDAAGDVVEVGSHVHGVSVGDRVYVNPGVGCGSCHMCSCRLRLFTRSIWRTAYLGRFGRLLSSKRMFNRQKEDVGKGQVA